jgi:hypothetical protein
MKGPGDAVVYDRIYTLVRESWDTKAKCVKLGSDTFQGVLCLYNVGIDVPTMCRSQYKKNCLPLKNSMLARKCNKSFKQKSCDDYLFFRVLGSAIGWYDA